MLSLRHSSVLLCAPQGAFQQTLDTALILAFANLIFHFHRPHPRYQGPIAQHAS
jgi:hypothetical protein